MLSQVHLQAKGSLKNKEEKESSQAPVEKVFEGLDQKKRKKAEDDVILTGGCPFRFPDGFGASNTIE